MIAKCVISISLVFAALGVGYLTLDNGLGWGWAILLTIVSWLVFAITIGVLYGKVGPYLPIFMQRPLYDVWCKRVSAIEMDGLVAYPFHIYMSLENPGEFKKGGLRQAMKAAETWLNEYPEKFTKAIEPVIEAKRRQLEAKEPAK